MAAQNHNMDHGSLNGVNFILTILLAAMSHIFTVSMLQGLAAFGAIVSSGFNIYFLIKRNKDK